MNKLIELEKKLHNSTNRQNSDFLREILHEDFFDLVVLAFQPINSIP